MIARRILPLLAGSVLAGCSAADSAAPAPATASEAEALADAAEMLAPPVTPSASPPPTEGARP